MASQLSGGNFYTLNQVYQSLLGSGFTPTQAANIAGVTGTEGGVGGQVYTGSFGYQGSETGGVLNPNGAYGIAQWNGPRQQDLQDFANSVGGSPSDLNVQTAFLNNEMASEYPNVNPSSISSIVTGYESPASQYVSGEVAGATSRAGNIDTSLQASNNPYAYGSSGSGGTAVASTSAGGATTEPGFSNPDQAYALPGALGDTTGVGAGTATMATNTPDLSAIIGGETPQQSAAIGPSIPDVQGATSQASPSGSGGIPISITDLSGLPGSVTQASTGLSKSVGSAATGVDKALGQATSTLSSAFTNLTGDWLQSIGNLFARGGLVLAGLVLLAGAFLWYTMDRPQATQVIKEVT